MQHAEGVSSELGLQREELFVCEARPCGTPRSVCLLCKTEMIIVVSRKLLGLRDATAIAA